MANISLYRTKTLLTDQVVAKGALPLSSHLRLPAVKINHVHTFKKNVPSVFKLWANVHPCDRDVPIYCHSEQFHLLRYTGWAMSTSACSSWVQSLTAYMPTAWYRMLPHARKALRLVYFITTLRMFTNLTSIIITWSFICLAINCMLLHDLGTGW